MDELLIQKLIEQTLKVREKAYSPYSNFKVGASVLFEESKIFSGCNVENASYGATNCAERTAIFKGISEGYRKINAICIIGSLNDYTYPCGICRQVISEFAISGDVPVIIAKSKDDFIIHKLSDLLPFNFGVENLV